MNATAHIVEALRLPELYRQICRFAGLTPSSTPSGSAERFVIRCGAEPPIFLAEMLEEAFLEDEAEVAVWTAETSPDYSSLPPGHVAVRPGFDLRCQTEDELRRAVAPQGDATLLFAVERRDARGRLLSLTWAAVPEAEPPAQAEFRAAVWRADSTDQGGIIR